MDANSVQALLKSFQEMARANQELVAEVKAGREAAAATMNTVVENGGQQKKDLPGAVALTGIKVPLDMGCSAEERLVNFHEWKEEIDDKMTVAGIDDDTMKTTIALMWGGKDVKTFAVEKAKVTLTTNGDNVADTWIQASKKIEDVMETNINEAFAMFKFRQGAQDQQSIDGWYKRLKSAVKTLRLQKCTCGLGYSEDRAIRDVMVELTNDSKLRKDALSKDLSLEELLKEGEANELARSRAATVENKQVMKLNVDEDSLTEKEASLMIAKLKKAGKYSNRSEKVIQKEVCIRCTKPRQPHTQDKCFFIDKTCRVCNQVGHMGGSKMCRGKDVRRVSIEYDFYDKINWEESESIGLATPGKDTMIRAVGKKNVVAVKVGNIDTEMFADSGAEVTIVPAHWYKQEMGKLQQCSETLRGYGSTKPLNVKAKFQARITTQKGAIADGWVYVVEGDEELQPLLGDKEATALGFLTFQPEGREPNHREQNVSRISSRVKVGRGHMPDLKHIPEITEEERKECWDIIEEDKYTPIFDKTIIGQMHKREPIVLQGQEGKRINSHPYRPIPPQFRKEISEHLQFLRDNGKIVDINPNTEKVEACSNVVITRKKTGQLRMSIDARPVNTAMIDIVTPHMNTPEDVRHRIAGSTRFSEFDMNHGYNQSTLSEESSRKYGVFQTHEGLHRFTSLYFGNSQATQAFNEDVEITFRGVCGVEHVADNLMVHAPEAKGHKENLRSFLDKCLEEGVTLSKEKSTVCEESIMWFGNFYGRDGVKPDPSKVQKLKEKGRPENQEEMRSFLQAAQFNARFMWNTDKAYAHITQPLRKLLGKGVLFEWGEEQQSSYERILEALESAGALYPYRPELEIRHVADAEPCGIASSIYMITLEDGEETWWPVNHISRSLSKTEMSYPQIDRESLAQSWGMGQNRYYLLGRDFISYTDHQPLLTFYNHTKKATPRIERHILKVQDLKYKMEYMSGKSNPADWNSRHAESIEQWSDRYLDKHEVDKGDELRLNRVIAIQRLDKFLHEAGITSGKRYTEDDISESGLKDPEYSATRLLIEQGRSDKVKGEYQRVAKELTVHEKVMLRDGKFVIPKGDGSMRHGLLEAAHEGHPGVSQLKSILRGTVFWPGITREVDDAYKSCHACQATKEGRHHKDKLLPNDPPERVWTKVAADHWGPLPDGTGRYILVLQDYLTKYPEAIVVNGTAAKDNIRALEETFGHHGYPESIVTDNGPPWNGDEYHIMKKYLTWAGIKHCPTRSADDPEANGLVERFMQEIGNSWGTAYVEGKNPLASLNAKLKMYRNTEHSVTKRKPSEWMYGRVIRTRLPERKLQTQHESVESKLAKERMIERGKLEKGRRDKVAREEELTVGMKVLLKQKKKRKGKPKYDPEPYMITELVGRQAVIQRGSSTLRRETQKIKRFYESHEQRDRRSDVVEDDWEETVRYTPVQNNPPERYRMGQGVERGASSEEIDVESNVDMPDNEGADEIEEINEDSTNTTRKSNREKRGPQRYGSWVLK